MTDQITTRRAIEVCLARLPMCDQSRRDLTHHLTTVIRDGEPPAPGDVDGLRAAIQAALDELTGLDPSFLKTAILGRVSEAGRRLQWALRDVQAQQWNGPGETPHRYSPGIMAMGDCRVCGHTYDAHFKAGAI